LIWQREKADAASHRHGDPLSRWGLPMIIDMGIDGAVIIFLLGGGTKNIKNDLKLSQNIRMLSKI